MCFTDKTGAVAAQSHGVANEVGNAAVSGWVKVQFRLLNDEDGAVNPVHTQRKGLDNYGKHLGEPGPSIKHVDIDISNWIVHKQARKVTGPIQLDPISPHLSFEPVLYLAHKGSVTPHQDRKSTRLNSSHANISY